MQSHGFPKEPINSRSEPEKLASLSRQNLGCTFDMYNLNKKHQNGEAVPIHFPNVLR